MRKIPIAVPSLGEEEWQALREPLMSGWLTQGPKVAAFEKRFAEIHNVKHALAVTSCTTGLHLALLAAGVGPGDEVIVPSFTWIATANAAVYCGATPVLADVSRDTYNIDPLDVAAKLTPRTKAVVAVHLFGLCADIDALRRVLPAHVKIVEDAACAAGAQLLGRSAGTLGDIAAFSFHPRKSVTTAKAAWSPPTTMTWPRSWTACAITEPASPKSSAISARAPTSSPSSTISDFNYRMTDLQGAIGLVQIEKLEGFVAERARWARWYADQLEELGWLKVPREANGSRHAWQAFVTYVVPERAPMPRNAMMEALQLKGISTRPGTHAVHMLGYYRKTFGTKPEDLPGARDCSENTMAIPLHNRMTEEDYAYVVDALRAL